MTAAVDQQLNRATGRILVADDDEGTRELLSRILTMKGHAVRLAEDGAQALAALAEGGVDVALLDVLMPRVDGLEVCRRLKADPKTAPIPVIVVTSLGEREDRIRGIAAGADDFLTKPFDLEELILRVRNALIRKRLYDELAARCAELQAMAELGASLTALLDADTQALRAPARAEAAEASRDAGNGGRHAAD